MSKCPPKVRIKNYLTKGKTISTKVKDCFLYNISKRTGASKKWLNNFNLYLTFTNVMFFCEKFFPIKITEF